MAEEKTKKKSELSEEETKQTELLPISEALANPEIEIKQVNENLEAWKPKTALGRKVKEGLIIDIDEIFKRGEKILEAEITDTLMPGLETDLLLIGQAKGKFGGGKRRVFRQTQKKTQEGNKIHFTTCALVGNKNGYIGLDFGKAKETVPARDSSIRRAKLNLLKIRRGCGSWQCNCGKPHSLPFVVEGKCGSSIVKLIPAPRGKGLCIEKECAKILKMAGIKDIWSKSKGQTKTKVNFVKALIQALSKLSEVKIRPDQFQKLGLVEGKFAAEESLSAADKEGFLNLAEISPNKNKPKTETFSEKKFRLKKTKREKR